MARVWVFRGRPAAETMPNGPLIRASAKHRVIQDEHYDGPDDGNKHAVEIETRDAGSSHRGKDEATDNRADDTEDNVEEQAFACSIHDHAGDEPSDETQDNPAND